VGKAAKFAISLCKWDNFASKKPLKTTTYGGKKRLKKSKEKP
jgi:hypothetical protein